MNAKGLVGGAVMSIIAVMIGIMMFPLLLSSTSDIQSDPASQVTYSVTGGGVTTDDILLTDPLYESKIANVTTITSNNGADTPAAASYVSATETLTVSGLAAAGTRNLTIAFEADALSGYTGLADFVALAPFIIFAALIIAGFAALYHSARG